LPLARLFFRGGSSQPVGQFFVNFSPVADGEDPDHPRFAIRFVNDAESSDFEPPHSPDNSRISGAPENGSALKDPRACLTLRFTSGGKW